jgi:hypothetical protein
MAKSRGNKRAGRFSRLTVRVGRLNHSKATPLENDDQTSLRYQVATSSSDHAELPTEIPDPTATTEGLERADVQSMPSQDLTEEETRTHGMLEAEENFKCAVQKLQTAMSNGSGKFQIVNVSDLLQSTFGKICEVEAIAQKLDSAVNKLIDERTKESATPHQQHAVKELIKGWFYAIFPAMKFGMNVIAVFTISTWRLATDSRNSFLALTEL